LKLINLELQDSQEYSSSDTLLTNLEIILSLLPSKTNQANPTRPLGMVVKQEVLILPNIKDLLLMEPQFLKLLLKLLFVAYILFPSSHIDTQPTHTKVVLIPLELKSTILILYQLSAIQPTSKSSLSLRMVFKYQSMNQ